jgi:hypothetical protein
MLEVAKYSRKPFVVDAIQVTGDNVTAVAEWCNGEVHDANGPGTYIKVQVKRALSARQTKAFVGDWVLKAGTGYKVYTPNAFANGFDLMTVREIEMSDANV